MIARRYTRDLEDEWNRFVAASRTPHFLLDRGYMEYHADRFEDASIVVQAENGSWKALVPASRHGDEVRSHGGLTFGGLVVGERTGALDVWRALLAACLQWRNEGATTLRYKPVPHIYHRVPAEDDLYALFRLGGRLVRRDLSGSILLSRRPRYAKGRRQSLRDADDDVQVRVSEDWNAFIDLETQVLRKHGTSPVHSGAELALLASRFPDAISLHAAYRGEQMLGGVVVYDTPVVCHLQYIGALPEGLAAGVLDRIIDGLIEQRSATHRWLDFGISSDWEGRFLNVGLAANKESYGARGVVYDQYELDLSALPDEVVP